MKDTDSGLVHLYWGKGKGKTTAAMGLALRALGHGRRVTILQFLKDGTSGEIASLIRLGAVVYAGKTEPGFASCLPESTQSGIRERQNRLLRRAVESDCQLLILDEACAADQLNLVDRELLKEAVLKRPEGREVVLTGMNPAGWMTEAADYCTEMHCCRHPYQRGIRAREGIEL